MSTDYNYDEQGQFFPFFIATMVGLVTVPLTYSLVRPNKDPENTAPRIHSDFKPEQADLIAGQKRKEKRKSRRLKRIITVVIGWAIIGFMIYLIQVTARTVPKLWDPYDILGISRSLEEKAIKSHYRKLSLKFHPDKIRPDPAKNETTESLNRHFVELTKAYKALTDEEIRNNYIQYGHPDGKQSFSIGIALPKLLVTEGNGKYVLLVYGLMLGVLLPYTVGKWWYGTQRLTRDGVLVATAGNLFRGYDDEATEGDVIKILSDGEEYKDALRGEREEAGGAKVESKITVEEEAGQLVCGMDKSETRYFDDLDSGIRRKTLALLWAYLGRVDLEDPTLNDEKYGVGPIALALNESFLAISLAFGATAPILNSFYTSQNLIQAIPPGGSPLLQLPYITPAIAHTIEGGAGKIHWSIQEFMDIPPEKRRKLAVGPGLLTSSQYLTAISVAKQLPYLEVEKAFFKVAGERYITPSSLVQFVIKARVIPPGTPNVPEVNELDLEDIDPEETDIDAILGRKGKAVGKDKTAKKPADDKPIQPPLAYAPYLARDHSPRWHVFLADAKQGRMVVPPFTFTTFDKPLFTPEGAPSFAMQTLKSQFQAPPQAGQYTFVCYVVCDSYVCMDTKMEVTLVVDEAGKGEELASEDDISEPDEDSLAGQMNALKSGTLTSATSAPRKKKTLVEESSSSEDESGTDEEEEDTSETDTDTDTEDES